MIQIVGTFQELHISYDIQINYFLLRWNYLSIHDILLRK